MKNISAIFGTAALCFCTIFSNAQAPVFDWVKPLAPTQSNYVYTTQTNSLVTDVAGNVYSCGVFSGTVDFDPGPGVFNLTAPSTRCAFVIKLDSAGNFGWCVQVGDSGGLDATSLCITPAGYLYMSGGFSDGNDFDPGPGVNMMLVAGVRNAYILKLDLNGNFIWSRSFGSSPISYVQTAECAADRFDNVVITTAFNGTVDVDPGPGVMNFVSTSNTNQDFYIIKLDPAGNLAWAKQVGSSSLEYSLSITTDQSGAVYTTGYFTNTLDFDPGPGVYNMSIVGNSRDVFIMKLDASGNFQWAHRFGDIYMDLCVSLVTDANNNIVLSGSFNGTVDFDPGNNVYNLTCTGGPTRPDIFVVKLNNQGEFIWARNWAHYGCGYGFVITADSSDAIYMTGNFKDTMDLDPGVGTYNVIATSSGPTDFFILKINSAGIFDWGLSSGGTAHAYGYSIAVSKFYQVYTSGNFSGTIDFDPGTGVNNVACVGSYNMYLHKLKQNITIGMPEQVTANTFTVYPNPGTGIFQLTGNEVAEKISVFDVNGREVFSLQPQAANVSLDLSSLADGVYTVRVNTADGVSAVRLVLQR